MPAKPIFCLPWLAAACWVAACVQEEPRIDLAPVDGVILVTLDTLRADRLGNYGYEYPTSARLDAFAAESVVFDWAIAQYPSTLASHLSIFTGLYPQEHGVVDRDLSLSPSIPLLAERFRAGGFRTAGYTENGMISPGSGLGRGFEEFVHEHIGPPQGPDRIFDLGVKFLDGLTAGERPFLWLHTYAVHTPYEPTADNRRQFLRGHPDPQVPVTGEYLTNVNRLLERASGSDVEAMSRLYDGQLRDVDSAFGRFLQALDERGWSDRLAVVVFADHGEEFLDHGHLVHEQVYPELIRVPLMVRHPRLAARRVEAMIETIDLAPTLVEIAGLDWRSSGSGTSLTPLLTGGDLEQAETAYAETEIGVHQRSIIQRIDGDLWQLVEHRFPVGQDGVWFSPTAEFDLPAAEIRELRLMAYHRDRRVTINVNGEPAGEMLLPPEWSKVRLDLDDECTLCRVRIETASCERPVDVGESKDWRCLAVKVRGGERWRYELYNLTRDPRAQEDLVRDHEDIFRRLLSGLRSMHREALHQPGAAGRSQTNEETLRTLGYLD